MRRTPVRQVRKVAEQDPPVSAQYLKAPLHGAFFSASASDSGIIASAMSIHVALNHVTRYRYDRAVSLSSQVVRLRPAPHCRTRILSYSMRVEPAKHFVNWQQD